MELELTEKTWQEILEDLPQQWIAAPASSRNAIPGAPMKEGAEIKKRNSEHRQAKEEAQKEHAKVLAEGRSDLELEILLRARGNASEVAKLLDLLEGDEAALYLLQNIPQKDLYELAAKAYYAELEPLLHQASDLPLADKAMYLLNPRVGVEIWSPYRVTKKDQEDIKPKDLLAKMEQRYQPGSVASLGSQMPLLVLADQAKLSIYDFTKLFVAELRRHGYPAKLIEAGIVEFYEAGKWEQVSVIQKSIATLNLTSEEEANWTLGQNYSIMKIENRLSPIAAHIKAWTESSPEIVLTPGNYLLITRTRLSNGDQLSAQQCFSLKEGESLDLSIELPKVSADEMLLDLKLDEPNLLKALALPKEGIGLAVFAQGGHEPTEHTLEELAMAWDGLQKLDHLTIYHDVGQGKQDLLQSSRFKNLQEKGEVEIQALDFATYFEALGRQLFVEAGTLPLIFLYERVEGEVIVRMSTAGYQVGLGEQIRQVLDHLK